MAKRIPFSERPKLFRDPDDWATDHGWVSRRRAKNIAAKIEAVASAIEGSLDDEGATVWTKELRSIAKTLAPTTTPAQRKVAAMQEP